MGNRNIFQWYDSEWFSDYFQTINYLKSLNLEKLKLFQEKMKVFETPSQFKTQILKQFCSESQLGEIQNEFSRLIRNKRDLEDHEMASFGRFVLRENSFFSDLQSKLLDQVQALTNEELEVSYHFLSLYNQEGICQPHLDAPFAKWTLDICVDQSKKWPIFFSDYFYWPDIEEDWQNEFEKVLYNEVNFQSYTLEKGDALLFSGTHFWHKRNKLSQQGESHFCHLALFHFIPKGTKQLVNPAHWPELFQCPELRDKLIHRVGSKIGSEFI